jgi:hypothetical protein
VPAPHPTPRPAYGEREGPGAKRWEGEGHFGSLMRFIR